jgi:triosephosphate isomerase
MRKQIAAANWKMNLTLEQGKQLLTEILAENISLGEGQHALFAVPFPYLVSASEILTGREGYAVSAQNCYHLASGAYTGEVSAEMLASVNIAYCLVGHSERRQYFNESDADLAKKIDLLLERNITPVFCCGESLETREAGDQNAFVQEQLKQSLFHLSEKDLKRIVIAYEPIWAIGTGKTASTEQAQEMHKHLRSVLAAQYGENVASEISILYGGSVKAANAKEIFSQEDVDGGLVGGASLNAREFIQIIRALS